MGVERVVLVVRWRGLLVKFGTDGVRCEVVGVCWLIVERAVFVVRWRGLLVECETGGARCEVAGAVG